MIDIVIITHKYSKNGKGEKQRADLSAFSEERGSLKSEKNTNSWNGVKALSGIQISIQ